jgi:hypothetical protein
MASKRLLTPNFDGIHADHTSINGNHTGVHAGHKPGLAWAGHSPPTISKA